MKIYKRICKRLILILVRQTHKHFSKNAGQDDGIMFKM